MRYEHFFGKINTDDAQRDIPSTDVRDVLNLVTENNNTSGGPRRETPLGNERVPVELPEGTNKCIGGAVDERTNSLLWFNWNSGQQHGIYQYFYNSNTTERVLLWSGLNFNTAFPVTHAEVVDGRYLVFTDGQNQPRVIDINRAKSGAYGALNEKKISFYRPQPVHPPVVRRFTDSGYGYNNIDDRNWQFAVRFQLQDGYYTLLSPYSELLPAPVISQRYTDNVTNENAIEVKVVFPADILTEVKRVQFLVREGNNGPWYIWRSEKIGDLTVVQGNMFTQRAIPSVFQDVQELCLVTVNFYNNTAFQEVDPTRAYTMLEAIPRQAGALTILKDRIFFNKKLVDRDISGSVSLNITRSVTSPSTVSGADARFLAKTGGKYSVGLIYSDGYGRVSPVQHRTEVEVPRLAVRDDLVGGVGQEGLFYGPDVVKVSARPVGTAPSWARYVQLVRTKELRFSTYMQVPANIQWYVQDFTEGSTVNGWEYTWRGRVFLQARPTPELNDDQRAFSYVCVHLPINSPFQPDTNCTVRFMTNDASDVFHGREYPVLDADGDLVFISVDIDDFTNCKETQVVEVYKRQKERDEVYYEVGQLRAVGAGGSFTFGTGIDIPFDTYRVRSVGGTSAGFRFLYQGNEIFEGYKGRFVEMGVLTAVYENGLYHDRETFSEPLRTFLESPSPMFGPTSDEADVYDSAANSRRQATLEAEIETQQNQEKASNISSGIGTALMAAGGIATATGAGAVVGIPLAAAGALLTAFGSLFGKKKRPPYIPRFLESRNGFVLNYRSADSSIGRPNTILDEFEERDRGNVIGFTGQYLGEVTENQLMQASPLDERALSVDDSKVTAMKPVDDVLVVWHEENTQSAYIGEAFIKTGNTNDFLIKTEGVITETRPLASGRYGCIHPDSIVVYQGRAYWWDQYQQEVIQYGNDGLNPLNTMYRMKKYALDKADRIRPYMKKAKVIGGYHPVWDMYLLSFQPVTFFDVVGDDPRYKGGFVNTREFLFSLNKGDIVLKDGVYQVFNGIENGEVPDVPVATPANFRVDTFALREMTSKWARLGGSVDSIQIQRAVSPEGPWTDVVALSGNSRSSQYGDGGLEDYTLYYYRMRFTKGRSVSGWITDSERTLGIGNMVVGSKFIVDNNNN